MLKIGTLKSAFTALAFVASVFWSSAGSAQDAVGSLMGVVTDAAGAPLAGAFVQMKNAERRLNFMVITQEQGKYTNDRLPVGKYIVQAIGGEKQSAPSAAVDVASSKPASVNLSLTVPRAPALPPAWPGREPGERGAEAEAGSGGGPVLADGQGKAVVEAKCQSCHDTQRIVRSRGDQARWQQVLRSMNLYAQGSTLAQPLTDDEEKVVLAYLSTNYAPVPGSAKPKPDPFSRLPRTLLPPAARNYMVVEYELPNVRAQPHEVAVDDAGNGWVTQRVGGRVGRLDLKKLTYQEFVPPESRSTVVRLNAIRRGNNGEFWMVDGGPNRRWLSFDPKTERFTVYELPPRCAAAAPAATPCGCIRTTRCGSTRSPPTRSSASIPATKQFTFFEVPAGVKNNKTANPTAWRSAATARSGSWRMPSTRLRALTRHRQVRRVSAAGEGSGRAQARRRLGRQSVGGAARRRQAAAGRLQDLQMTEFTPPTRRCRRLSGRSRHEEPPIWTSLHHVDKLGRLDPATGAWTEFPLMFAETDVRRIEVDPNNPKRVWYSGVLSSRIGYVELLQ